MRRLLHITLCTLVLAFALAAAALAAEGNGGEVTDVASLVGALGGEEYIQVDGSDGVFTVTLKSDLELKSAVHLLSGSYTLLSDSTHTLTRAEGYTGALIQVNSGASLVLGAEGIAADAQPTLILDGGAVWADGPGSANSGLSAGSSLISSGGTLVMHGGVSLQNNVAYNGGGVSSSGSFVMNGGYIQNNYANSDDPNSGGGGGVHFGSSSFTMTGGHIQNNATNQKGGGVMGSYTGSGLFTLTGGTLHQNTAAYAGGIYAQYVVISGGEITANTSTRDAQSSPYCVIFGSYKITVRGGTIRGNRVAGSKNALRSGYGAVYLSGSPVIEDNILCQGRAVVVEGALQTATPVVLHRDSYPTGTVVVQGSGYTLTEQDVALFTLDGAPERALLICDSANNCLKVTYFTPIRVQGAQIQDGSVYDGRAVALGDDFTVSVFTDPEEGEGEEVTENYTVGGGALSVTYSYRPADSLETYTGGLPVNAGSYTVLVTVAADNAHTRSGGSGTFLLTIQKQTVTPTVTAIGSRPFSENSQTVPEVEHSVSVDSVRYTVSAALKTGETGYVGARTAVVSFTLDDDDFVNYTFAAGQIALVEHAFAILPISDPAAVSPSASAFAGKPVDLSPVVSGARGAVSYALKSGGGSVTAEGLYTPPKTADTAVVTVAVADTDLNGDGVAEYTGKSVDVTVSVTALTPALTLHKTGSTVTLTLTDAYALDGNQLLLFAAYTGGRLEALEQITFTVTDGSFSTELTPEAGDSFQCFLLQSGTYSPVCSKGGC